MQAFSAGIIMSGLIAINLWGWLLFLHQIRFLVGEYWSWSSHNP